MESSRNKQSVSFKLCADLSSMMKSHAFQLSPARDMNHSFVQCIYAVCATRLLVTLVALSVIRLTIMASQHLCSSDPYLLNNGPNVQG